VGKARESTVEAAEKMIREAEDADENNGALLSTFVTFFPDITLFLHFVCNQPPLAFGSLTGSLCSDFSQNPTSATAGHCYHFSVTHVSAMVVGLCNTIAIQVSK